jgi:hypothetical protein
MNQDSSYDSSWLVHNLEILLKQHIDSVDMQYSNWIKKQEQLEEVNLRTTLLATKLPIPSIRKGNLLYFLEGTSAVYSGI